MARRYKNAELITGAFARTLVEKAGLLLVPTSEKEKLTILDNACGIGAVAAALHEMLDQGTKARMALTCGDFAAGMLEAVRERIAEEGWANTEVKLVDAQKTDLPDASFTHVLANFVIMGLQEPDAALNECYRILRPAGTLGFTTWQHVDWIADLRAAFATLPGPPPFPDDLTMYRSWGGQGDWQSVDWVRTHLQNSTQFADIEVEAVGKDLVFDSPEKFVDTFSVMVPFILKKFWSESERRELGEMAVPRLLEYMNGKYGEGGPVRMHWVANVVTAKKLAEEKEGGGQAA
ncbi:MAG: hypothetical protein Q9208_007867 [Pyrenodesmia sp. 3 TL-2023]